MTFYDKKTERRVLKRKQKEIWHKRLSVHTISKFNRAIVTNTSNDNLAEGLDLKKPIQVLLSKNNVCCQNLNKIKKGYLICSTRTLDQL